MEAHWTETTKRIVAVVGVVVGFVLLYLARPVLPMVLMAAVVAYALYPIVTFLHRRLRFPHTLATVTVYLLLLLALAAIPVLLGPYLLHQVRSLDLNFVELGERAREWLRTLLERWRTASIAGAKVDLRPVIDPALDALGEAGSAPVIPPPGTWLPKLSKWLSGFASTVTSALVAFFLTILYSFYMVKDAPRWQAALDPLVPEAYREEFRELRRRLALVWSAFFRGQLVLCLVMAAITFVLLVALGIPGAIPLALLAGLMEVVPNLGPFLALVPAVLVALVQGSMWIPLPNFWVAVIVVGAYVLLQQVENNFLCPRIVGGSIDLPPLVVLVGVVVGVTSAGLVGAYLSGPILASLKVLALYAYNKILDRAPFPELKAGAEEEAILPVPAQPRRRPRTGKRPARTLP